MNNEPLPGSKVCPKCGWDHDTKQCPPSILSPALPDDLAKAVEEAESFSAAETMGYFKTTLTAAKLSREKDELIERLVEALNKSNVDEHVVNCPDCIQALHFNLSAYANGKLKLNLCDQHRKLVVAAVNSLTGALSLAHSKGFGQKK